MDNIVVAELHSKIDKQLDLSDRPVAHFALDALVQLMRNIQTIADVAEARARADALPGFHQ